MQRDLFRLAAFAGLMLLAAARPAAAEPLTVDEITGPLSFRSGTQEYVFSRLYAPGDAMKTLDFLKGRTIDAAKGEADRWERIDLASPVELDLLRSGAAQLQPVASAPSPDAVAAEEEARRNRAGLWNAACCRVLNPDAAERGLNSWRIIEGRIASVTMRRDVTYLNFGTDWKTDFTVVVPARLAKDMALETRDGQQMQVRGYLEWRYGPSMTLSHPSQIRWTGSATP